MAILPQIGQGQFSHNFYFFQSLMPKNVLNRFGQARPSPAGPGLGRLVACIVENAGLSVYLGDPSASSASSFCTTSVSPAVPAESSGAALSILNSSQCSMVSDLQSTDGGGCYLVGVGGRLICRVCGLAWPVIHARL